LILNLLLGLGLGGATAWLGYHSRRGAPRFLGPDGAIGVVVLSVLTFLAGGWTWGLAPVLFFLTTGIWARFRHESKRALGERFQSGATRHLDQVLARGGWGAILAILHVLASGPPPAGRAAGAGITAKGLALYAAFVGAWAATTADAWATEIGVLSALLPGRNRTRLLISQRQVSAGVPGGISLLGLMAGVVGSWLQGLVALLGLSIYAWLDRLPLSPGAAYLPSAAMLGGLAGSLTDSLLGAAAQGIYYCEQCDQLGERPWHTCGQQAQQIRGWSWLTNDWVNLMGSLVGAAVTAALVIWLAQLEIRW
jgi:uncharacterized protein (TIGR00297 family)